MAPTQLTTLDEEKESSLDISKKYLLQKPHSCILVNTLLTEREWECHKRG